MNHTFDREIAERYGLEEAIVLNNFYFWIDKNIKNEKHFHDGHYWTYNSLRALAEMMPYMTQRKIGLVIDNLVEKNILMKGCYNADPHDRTNWYAITEFGFQILKDPLMTHSTSRGMDDTSRSIDGTRCRMYNNETAINTDINLNTGKTSLPTPPPKKGLISAPRVDTKKKTKYSQNRKKLESVLAEFSFSQNSLYQLSTFLDMIEQSGKWVTEVSFRLQLEQLSSLSAIQQIEAVKKTITRGWGSLDYAIAEATKAKTPSFETATKSENQIFIKGSKEWQERQDKMKKDIEAGNIF